MKSLRHQGLYPASTLRKKMGGLGISHKPVALLQRLNRLSLGSRVTPVIFDNVVYELNCERVHVIG